MYESLKAGKIISVEMKESIAEGLFGGIEKDSIMFSLVRKYVDNLLLVKEETIKQQSVTFGSKKNKLPKVQELQLLQQ